MPAARTGPFNGIGEMTLSRRDFLLGATAIAATIAVPIVAEADKLPKYRVNEYLIDPDAWFIVTGKPEQQMIQWTEHQNPHSWDNGRFIYGSAT